MSNQIDDAIHADIKSRLIERLSQKSIPHMIFHGSSGSGKRTLVNWFLRKIYDDNKVIMNKYILYADCAHGKGIKFIREQVKFFAKTNLSLSDKTPFKTIVLTNADKLTTDAQSALRRIIEIFSHSTRFFVVVEEKFRMLLPILSRLSDVYVPRPIIDDIETNLNVMTVTNIYKEANIDGAFFNGSKISTNKRIGNIIRKYCSDDKKTIKNWMFVADECYQQGLCCDDIIKYVECKISAVNRSQFLLMINKMREQYRSEPLLMMTILFNGLVRSNQDFVNVGFM